MEMERKTDPFEVSVKGPEKVRKKVVTIHSVTSSSTSKDRRNVGSSGLPT